MNQNLKLLRQNYCRPGTVAARATHRLFPLEKQCAEGRAFAANMPGASLGLEEFDPSGLERTYRDEATGAALPVYAFFDLEGEHRLAFEITSESVPAATHATSLMAHMPFKKSQTFVKELNEPRIKAERLVRVSAMIAGMIPGLAYLFFHIAGLSDAEGLCILLGGCAVGAALAYILGISVLDWICPWKKLVIKAEFNGILPKEAREKARAAKDHFDNLYLIVDQQQRWRSTILPDPRPRDLDPLLIGELKQGHQSKFFLIHQFELTAAEKYLTNEFATRPV